MAPAILDSLKPFVVWDKFQVYQGHNWHTPVISIGTSPPIQPKIHQNPIEVALKYKKLLDDRQARSKAEVAELLGVSRAKVTQMMHLLKLDTEIQDFILGLDETDERLKQLTERRLRELVKIKDRNMQKERFLELV